MNPPAYEIDEVWERVCQTVVQHVSSRVRGDAFTKTWLVIVKTKKDNVVYERYADMLWAGPTFSRVWEVRKRLEGIIFKRELNEH